MVLIAIPLAALASVALGSKTITGNEGRREQAQPSATVAAKPQPVAFPQPRALPDEVRGVHVTMALASLDGKLDEYVALRDEGLNAIQLDVKDENGEIGFVPSAVPLAGKIGAARPYYRPREVARMMHKKGIYLIGRVVVFEDPVLSENAPAPGDQAPRRVALAQPRGARLVEPPRQARLGLQRVDRRGGRTRRVRRDPVRLRALPLRRRRG